MGLARLLLRLKVGCHQDHKRPGPSWRAWPRTTAWRGCLGACVLPEIREPPAGIPQRDLEGCELDERRATAGASLEDARRGLNDLVLRERTNTNTGQNGPMHK